MTRLIFKNLLISSVLAFLLFSGTFARSFDLSDPILADSAITIGKLENGLTYYIKVNKKPEDRAELRLAVNAGSVLENDDQQGLAHFDEHMAFNGTKNFAKHELIDYLESIGMKYGPEINAETGFDETIYMLEVPTDSVEIMKKAFLILSDWAHRVSYEDEEINKERGVVIEEWRLGRGANMRMLDKQLPILFKGSVYADRLPIGKKAVLDTFKYATAKQFYHDWYRPDLMAVIAVGDFDKSQVEELIKDDFSAIPLPEKRRERKMFPVPDTDETLFAIATDPEATSTRVSLYFKQDVQPESTVADYRRTMMVEGLYNQMLNQRFQELLQQSEPPFLYGYSAKGRIVRTKEVYYLTAAVKDSGIEKGLETLLTEAERVRRFGFTESELERAKAQSLRRMEQLYQERDKTESASFAAEFIRNFLEQEPIPGIKVEYELYQKYLPGISLDEVNRLAGEWITDNNRVILISASEKDGNLIPTREDMLALFKSVNEMPIKPYVDAVSNKPLIEKMPAPGKIKAKKYYKNIDVTEWTLSNGVKVVLKPTDFKNDEIQFASYSPGGSSLAANKDYIAAATATSVVDESGFGAFDKISLQKKLAGKVVSVSPYIGSLTEGISGNSSPKDMETMFQLIYLIFTEPRADTTAFLSYRTRMKGYIENRSARPETAFSDTVQVTLAQYHFRARPWSLALLDEMNLGESLSFYMDRFANASDFTFFFVGNFDLEGIRPLVETYIGGLPSSGRKETWKDVGMDYPTGIIEKVVKRGIEPKSRVQIVFSGPYQWSRENNYAFRSMISALRIKLREAIREDKSGTYGVSIGYDQSRYPKEDYSISISFGCAPERVEELTAAVFSQIDSVKNFGFKEIYLTKVRETQYREYEKALKENDFWLDTLNDFYFNELDPQAILSYPSDFIDKLSLEKMQQAANRYFKMDNYVRVVLYPEHSLE
jgi:zinc protease